MTAELDLTDDERYDDEVDRVARAVQRMVEPVWRILDRFDDHLDPATAPPPVVSWLGTLLGLDVDADSAARRRTVLADAPSIYPWWGTSHGLAVLLSGYLGLDPAGVEITESGGVAWSTRTGGRIPGSALPYVKVTITVPDPETVDVVRLERLLRAAVPAHVPFETVLRASG
jgi:phage tail-like protein